MMRAITITNIRYLFNDAVPKDLYALDNKWLGRVVMTTIGIGIIINVILLNYREGNF